MICSVDSVCNEKIQKRDRDSGLIYFQFPNQLFRTKLFEDAQDLAKDICRLGMKCYFRKGRVFNRDEQRNQNGIKIVFKCKTEGCPARLIYHKKANGAFFEPVIFENLHRHNRSKDPQKAKRQDINVFIMQLKGEEYEKYRKIPKWIQRFDVTNAEGLWIVEQLYWCFNTQDETLTYLAQQNITIRRFVVNEQTLLIFMVSENMKKNFLLYGETITIETHSDTGKKRAVIENHAVGYLFGQNQNMELVLLGIFMIAQSSKTIYRKIFEFFFETICTSVMPICIVSDQKQEITDALEELRVQNKYEYFHLHPWYHMTIRLMEKLKKVKNKQKIMELMCQAMQETNQHFYFLLMSQLKTYLKQDPSIFQYFAQNQNKYCFRRIPAKFSGFAISTNFGKKVIAQITDSAIYRAHSGRFFTRLLKIQRDLMNSQKKIYKIHLDVIRHFPEQITILWRKMEANIMEILIVSYNNSKDCELNEENDIRIKIRQKNGKQFLCNFSIEGDHWQCQCQQLQRTGLPCCHLLRILLDPKYRASLLYYINSRWMHTKEEKNSYLIGPFITNKLRRH